MLRMPLLLMTIAWLLNTAPVAAKEHGLIDLDLHIRLVPSEHRLEARAVLTLATKDTDWPSAYRLAAQSEIDSVTSDGKPMYFKFDAGRLQIPSVDGLNTLEMVYRVRFDDTVPQDTVGIENPSFGVTATIMPQGAFLSASSGWHPLPVDVTSRFRVTITGPPGWSAVTSGRLVAYRSNGDETLTTWQTALPQPSLTLAAGRYQLHRDDLGDIQLLIFTSPENSGLAHGYLESCREYLQLYQQLFGPYPYAKFAVVENFFPTGYGFPGWTLLGSSVVKLPFIRTTSLPHEIAHAWWGNAVAIDEHSGNWSEGLATYVADYYLKERNAPAEALEYRRKILRDYASLVDTGDDLPLSAFRSRTSKRDQAIGYGKAAMVYHMLRDLVGDEAFWSGLQAAARHGLGKRYGWDDLQRHFEAASGRQLDHFFHQWIDRTGAPQLQLTDVRAKQGTDGWQITGTILQGTPFYTLDVPLRLETSPQGYDRTVKLADRQSRFSFTVPDRPVSLAVDPQSVVFRKLYPEELPATVNDLRASRQPLVVIASGSEALFDASRDLLRGLQWHLAPVMKEADYLSLRPTDRDLLVLGWPASPDLRPILPDDIRVAAHQFMIDGTLDINAEDVLFLVIARPNENRVAGYFLPGSAAAAKDTARRIPHYGRYSHLAFRHGQNFVRSTWEPARSPLKHRFDEDVSP